MRSLFATAWWDILGRLDTRGYSKTVKSTNKVIIGMNQAALWGGEQQMNRGFKYLINNELNTENSKLLCVVCNEIE